MKVIATNKVSLFWQTVFAILIDVFAFYRIKKLRRFLLLVVIPTVLLTVIPLFAFYPTDSNCVPDLEYFIIYDKCQGFHVQVYSAIVNGAFLVYSIYLVRKWSVQWNSQFKENQ